VTRVLIDVNVVLDVLAAREPFVADSQAVLQLVEARAIEGVLAAHSVATLHYLLSKYLSKVRARKTMEDLLHILRVEPVNEDRLRHALAMNWADFEDAVQAACAEKAEADYLVTRDKKGFKRSAVRPVTPAELVAIVT
jgi:predicted nucleic acid-binding protein